MKEDSERNRNYGKWEGDVAMMANILSHEINAFCLLISEPFFMSSKTDLEVLSCSLCIQRDVVPCLENHTTNSNVVDVLDLVEGDWKEREGGVQWIVNGSVNLGRPYSLVFPCGTAASPAFELRSSRKHGTGELTSPKPKMERQKTLSEDTTHDSITSR